MSDHHHHSDTSNLKLAFFLNVSFTLIEIVGGLLTNSLAIISDAIHDLGDSISLGMAWYLQKVSKRSKDHLYTYGYRRFSILGAIITSIVLIIGSFFIIYGAILRISEPEHIEVQGMIYLAFLGIAVNGFSYYRTRRGQSQNEKVVSLHLLEDVLGWIAVLVGAVIITFTGWTWIDSILSLMITVYITIQVIRRMKTILKIILQAVPDHILFENISEEILKIEGVADLHDLHIWSLDGQSSILTAHIRTDYGHEHCHELKSRIKETLRSFQIIHCTLEIEHKDDPCSGDII